MPPIRPDRSSPGAAPIGPKKPLPGEDANIPGQPPFVDIEDSEGEQPQRGKGNPAPRQPSAEELEIDRGEPGHVESAENVESDMPSKREQKRR
jgi:hypothetical protein